MYTTFVRGRLGLEGDERISESDYSISCNVERESVTASLGAMVHYKLPLDLSACPSAATLAHARARPLPDQSSLVCSARTTHALATIAMVTPYSPEQKLNPDLCCHEFLFYKYIQVRSPNLVLKHKRKLPLNDFPRNGRRIGMFRTDGRRTSLAE